MSKGDNYLHTVQQDRISMLEDELATARQRIHDLEHDMAHSERHILRTAIRTYPSAAIELRVERSYVRQPNVSTTAEEDNYTLSIVHEPKAKVLTGSTLACLADQLNG